MSKILKMSDRIKIKVGKTTFIIGPLNQMQKIELSECTKMAPGGEEVYDLSRAQVLLIKYGLKGLEGVTDAHGDPYKLEFENDILTDDCLSEVFTLEARAEYLTAAWQCLNNLPDKITDPVTGKKMKGVALELVPKKVQDG